jgi:hypothetical protein
MAGLGIVLVARALADEEGHRSTSVGDPEEYSKN